MRSLASESVMHAPVVVFVDTTNLCRSPAAAAIFASHVAAVGLAVHVRSAGTQAVHGAPASKSLRRAAGPALGALSIHRSAPFAGEMATGADLVLTMDPSHLVQVVTAHPEVLPRAFTWKGLLELSSRVAPHGEGLAGWVARLHDRREARGSLTSPDPVDESVARGRDGFGGRRRLLNELDAMAARTAALLAAASLPIRSPMVDGPRHLQAV